MISSLKTIVISSLLLLSIQEKASAGDFSILPVPVVNEEVAPEIQAHEALESVFGEIEDIGSLTTLTNGKLVYRVPVEPLSTLNSKYQAAYYFNGNHAGETVSFVGRSATGWFEATTTIIAQYQSQVSDISVKVEAVSHPDLEVTQLTLINALFFRPVTSLNSENIQAWIAALNLIAQDSDLKSWELEVIFQPN